MARKKPTAPDAPGAAPRALERVPLDALVLDPANARRHPEKNLEAIKGSLLRFGQYQPIVVDKGGVVRVGNGRVEAMRALGWTHADALRVEHLSASELAALAIADNRTGELAEWDFEALAATLGGLQADGIDLGALGWAEHDLEPLLAAEWAPPPLDGEDEASDAHPEDPAAETDHREAWTVVITADQRAVVERAVASLREDEGDESIPVGRCLELIAADFLSGR